MSGLLVLVLCLLNFRLVWLRRCVCSFWWLAVIVVSMVCDSVFWLVVFAWVLCCGFSVVAGWVWGLVLFCLCLGFGLITWWFWFIYCGVCLRVLGFSCLVLWVVGLCSMVLVGLGGLFVGCLLRFAFVV